MRDAELERHDAVQREDRHLVHGPILVHIALRDNGRAPAAAPASLRSAGAQRPTRSGLAVWRSAPRSSSSTYPASIVASTEFLPGQTDAVATRLDELRCQHEGASLEAMDVKMASTIDSLNLSSQPMTWAGVPTGLGRTFVRCLRDPIQPLEMQARFAAWCGAGAVVDIDAGHTPAIDEPAALAAILDDLVARVGAAPATASGG